MLVMRIAPLLLAFGLAVSAHDARAVTAVEPPLVIFLEEGSHWAPFIMDPASEDPGVRIEATRAVFAEAGLTVVERIVSRSRALRALDTGQADFEVGATIWDVGRDVEYVASDPLFATVDALILAPKTHLAFTDCADLAGVRLWGVEGYSYPCAAGADLRGMANERALVFRVTRGDIAIAIVEESVARYWGARLGVEPQIGPTISRADQVVKLALNRAHLLEPINAAIARLQDRGAFEAIKAAYLAAAAEAAPALGAGDQITRD